MTEWTPADYLLPEPDRKVLVYYRNEQGKHRIIIGFYLPEKYVEANTDYDEIGEYDEEADEYFYPKGWYEAIDNWPDYSSLVIHHEVLYWAPLPAVPK